MDKQTEAHLRLVAAIKPLVGEKREALEQEKAEISSQWKRPDFIWHHLLLSFSTWGNSRGGYGLIDNIENYNKVTFEALSRLGPSERFAVLERTLLDAKVRWPNDKAEYLNRNFNKIVEMGGLSVAKAHLKDAVGRQEKIEFLTTFDGIGPKLAVKCRPHVYHP
jgi:hypothetical protein